MKRIVSIDVGIQHLGVSETLVTDEYDFMEIVMFEMIDITTCRLPKPCSLHHTPCFSDWIQHIMVEYKEVFDRSDRILIERQPPQGLVAIEQLFYFQYREKALLVHPRVVHTYLMCGYMDYEGRKLVSEKSARMYLSEEQKERFDREERRHDIADSICMMLWWIEQQRKVVKIKTKLDATGLERFRYVPRLKR